MKINFCLACKNSYLIFVRFSCFFCFFLHAASKFLLLENVKQIKIMEKFCSLFVHSQYEPKEYEYNKCEWAWASGGGWEL